MLTLTWWGVFDWAERFVVGAPRLLHLAGNDRGELELLGKLQSLADCLVRLEGPRILVDDSEGPRY